MAHGCDAFAAADESQAFVVVALIPIRSCVMLRLGPNVAHGGYVGVGGGSVTGSWVSFAISEIVFTNSELFALIIACTLRNLSAVDALYRFIDGKCGRYPYLHTPRRHPQ